MEKKKSKRGGARPGSGRKSYASKLLDAGHVLPFYTPEFRVTNWKSFLQSSDEKIRLDATKYIDDRLYGKAVQQTDLRHDIEIIKRVVSDL